MGKYITEVNYIDTKTGEILTKKELGNRNFLETKRNCEIKYENGTYKRRIEHFGTIGSESKGDSQLRLL